MYYEGYKIFISGGYPAIYVDKQIIRLHIIEMEKHLGRKLKNGEIVHHKDENKMNYLIDNLLCFRSNSDHVAYHKGLSYELDSEGIAYCPDKSININHMYYKNCPECGLMMSRTSKKCVNCHKKHVLNSSRKPTYDELKHLMSTIHNFTHIGKLYGVTGNAVKKWCKSYNIDFSFRIEPMSRDVLVELLKDMSISDISRTIEVDRSTINSWIDKYDITYVKSCVKCVELDSTYDSMLKAADVVYPFLSRKSAANYIGKIINTNKQYHGYHWISVDCVVY